MDRITVDGGCVVIGIVVGGNVDVHRSTLTEHKSCNHNNSDHIFIEVDWFVFWLLWTAKNISTATIFNNQALL
ncbi:hypothetical protein YC2023_011456 [Brassica napus]